MENGENLTNQELQDKVNELTKRVEVLEKTVLLLGEGKKVAENVIAPVVNEATINTEKKDELELSVPKMDATSEVKAPQAEVKAQTLINKVEKKKNVESRIGKNLMAIVASVLILLSLILFGGLILPYITSTVRYVIMLALSLAFSVFGICRMKKGTRLYALYSAIAAVGVSGFYITNLIAYFGFHILSEVPLMLLIMVWLAGTIALAKLKSRMFLCISNSGLIISAILATAQWSSIYLGMCVYFIGVLILYFMNRSKDYNKDAYVFLQIPLMLGFFVFFYYETWQMFLWAAIAVLIYLIPLFVYKIERKHEPLLALGFIFTALLTMGISIFLLIKEVEYGVLFTIVMITIAVVMRYKKPSVALVYITHYAMIVSLLGFNIVPAYRKYLGCLAIAIILLALGYIRDIKHIKYPGFAYLLISILWHPEFIEGMRTIGIIFAVLIVLYAVTYRNYSAVDKYLCTALMLVLQFDFYSTMDVSETVAFLITGMLCVYVNSKLFILNYENKESEMSSQIVSYIFMAIMLFFAMAELSDKHAAITIDAKDYLSAGPTTILVILMSLALCTMNVRRILHSKLPAMLVGCYNCIKYTILMLLILDRFDVAGFALTLCTLLFAIGCIVLGFIKKYKPFRIYGLVITLISVLKLVLFDIEYDSNLMRPVGFLIAGLLCFGISWGYTQLEKNQGEEEEKEAVCNQQ